MTAPFTRTTSAMPMQKRCRIGLTGGPGGGKTTAADLFRRELGERVVIVPESATILFAGGFPVRRSSTLSAPRRSQSFTSRQTSKTFSPHFPRSRPALR